MEGLGFEEFRTPDQNADHVNGSGVHYTYTNAFRVNDRIFVTTFGEGDPDHTKRDQSAIATWQLAAPGVEIVPINAYPIIYASGAFHCIVMQVPRHTGVTPTVALTSPVGGELLVPGASHEITWAASDDVGVDSVDLLYSIDNGVTFPGTIAFGEPNDSRFSWTVPFEITAEAVVKVVAHDADAQTGESAGAAPLTCTAPAPKARRP